MQAIIEAVETGDQEALEARLADDVRFVGPVVSRSYDGKAITAAILRGVSRVVQDVRYVRAIEGTDGRHLVLLFEAVVGGHEINGCDVVHLDDNGQIDEIVVMVRPLSAAKDLSAALGAQFRQILDEARAAAG